MKSFLKSCHCDLIPSNNSLTRYRLNFIEKRKQNAVIKNVDYVWNIWLLYMWHYVAVYSLSFSGLSKKQFLISVKLHSIFSLLVPLEATFCCGEGIMFWHAISERADRLSLMDKPFLFCAEIICRRPVRLLLEIYVSHQVLVLISSAVCGIISFSRWALVFSLFYFLMQEWIRSYWNLNHRSLPQCWFHKAALNTGADSRHYHGRSILLTAKVLFRISK